MNDIAAKADKLPDLAVLLELQDFLSTVGIHSALYSQTGTLLELPGHPEENSSCRNLPACCGNLMAQLQQQDSVDIITKVIEGKTFKTDNYSAGMYQYATCDQGKIVFSIPIYQRRQLVAYLMCCLPQWQGYSVDQTVSAMAPVIQNILTKSRQSHESGHEIEALSDSLTQTYEELSLLHHIGEGMRITQPPQPFFAKLAHDIKEVIEAEELLIFWRKVNVSPLNSTAVDNACEITEPMVTSTEKIHFSNGHLQMFWNRSEELISKDNGSLPGPVLIESDIDGPCKHDWPSPVRNLVIVPIRRNESTLGSVIAINKVSRPDFDSVDTQLLLSTANEIAVYLDNIRLYDNLQDLLVGSLRALTSSIDAKDPYTCGHSERVAIAARFLAERLELDDEQTNTIYLAGLLHDIGKIGVSESVLRKEGRLTDAEYQQIKSHPQIGANIMGGIKQMAMVSQIILSHHERFDGHGYPRGLAGHDILFAGRIIMLADSFDAMISDRIYRRALPVDVALAEIRRFSGTQFDPRLADIFLDSDIKSLVEQLDNASSYRDVKTSNNSLPPQLSAITKGVF
jgi:putative nucleotidyltransferase with HDIG domain